MDMVSFANGLLASLHPINRKPTHCFELAGRMTEGLERKELHFITDGIRAVVSHEDGLDYEVVVRPLKKIAHIPNNS